MSRRPVSKTGGRDTSRRMTLSTRRICLIFTLAIGSLAFVAPSGAAEQASGDGLCMEDLFTSNLNCTSNDVAISGVAIDPSTGVDWIEIKDDGCAYPGDTVDFDAVFEVFTNAVERFDIGVYFATDGDKNEEPPDGALTGACTVATLPTDDPDGNGPLIGLDLDEDEGQPDDSCGDINKANNPMLIPVSLTGVSCVDFDNDGFLNLPNCISWRQKGANKMCSLSTDAFPGAPSKCRCDAGFNVPITVPPAKLLLVKTATTTSIPEGTPKDVVFTIKVTNPGPDPSNYVLLSTLTDDVFGDLTDTSNSSLKSTTCNTLASDRLDADGSDEYTCSFTATLVGDSGVPHKNTATVRGMDMHGNSLGDDDDATVTFTDVLPVIAVTKTANPTSLVEPGGNVVFSVSLKNDSNMEDPVTITSLNDDVHGNITLVQGDISATTCATGSTLDSGQTYTCNFTANVTGSPGYKETDIVTGKAKDDEGNEATDTGTATVLITDFTTSGPPITVTKTANPTSVDEPGADVVFSVSVKNNSSVDSVTIDSMDDDVHGDITKVQGDISATRCTIAASNCSVGRVLAPLASCSCDFTTKVDLNPADATYEKDTVTVMGTDDDGQSVEDYDDAVVNVRNVAPTATVTKSVESAKVTYKVVVTNTSTVEDLTLSRLTDDKFGDLTDSNNPKISNSTCVSGAAVPKGGAYPCYFDGVVDAADSPHTNTVTAEVTDDEGSKVSPTDSAIVEFK